MTKTLAAILVVALGLTAGRAGDPKQPKLPDALKPAAADDDLRKLKVEHANTLLVAVNKSQERIDGGVFKGTDELTPLVDTLRRLLDARLELEATAAGKQQELERFAAYAGWLDRVMDARKDVDDPSIAPRAKAYRLEVEIRLAEFKRAAK